MISAGTGQDPAPTLPLGELLHQYSLGLVVVAGASAGMHERELRWVHVSELEDPTPFLPPRTVLLTTGARFSSLPWQRDADDYVRRLVAAGTTAIGFAVGLHWDRVPTRFVAACDAHELPLFRVPYDTAFIEIVQTAAGLIDAQLRERDRWALESQRAVAQASLHPDALTATLQEASARLGRWVWVSDRAGHAITQASPADQAAPPVEALRREVRRLAERGVSSIRVEDQGGGGFRIQSLGRRGRELGVLAVEDRGAPDTAERTVIELVAALSTARLEQRSALDGAHAVLHSAAAQLLIEGHPEAADRLAGPVLPRIPREPLVVVRLSGAGEPRLAAPSAGVLRAEHDGTPILILEAARLPGIRRDLAEAGLAAGVSSRGSRGELPLLVAQADRALAHARRGDQPGPVDYSPALHDGMLHLLEGVPAAEAQAATLLAPLRDHDRRHCDDIERSLTVWLAHHGQTSPAAAELGVHRHTLRGRVSTAAELLQLDLDSPDSRADLWAALRLAQRPEAAGSEP